MSGPVDAKQIRGLSTADLALLLLRTLAGERSINSNSTFRGAHQAFEFNGEHDIDVLLSRLSDAWAWLVAHGLIGPDHTQTGPQWQRLTRDGRQIAQDAAALPKLWAANRLAGSLDPALESKVRPLFNLGDYETACFAAMKEVEVAVREAEQLPNSTIGVALMQQVFKAEGGALTDPEADAGERVAIMQLFAGSIGAFKNPSSHRTVHFDDAGEAAEVVQLADLLLRLFRRAAARRR